MKHIKKSAWRTNPFYKFRQISSLQRVIKSLKKWINGISIFITIILFTYLVKCRRTLLELNSKVPSSEREREFLVACYVLQKREIRRVLHVESCCFVCETCCCFDVPVAVAVVVSYGPYCSKMWLKAILRVLAPTFKHVLQPIRLLHGAQILTYDWLKSRRSHTIHRIYVTCSKTSLPWAGKTRNVYILWQKVEPLSTFRNNFSQLATT